MLDFGITPICGLNAPSYRQKQNSINTMKTMASKWITIVCIIQCFFFTITDAQPSITLNGNPSSQQTYELNDTVTITCNVSSSYTSISSYYIRRGSSSYYYNIGSSNTGSTTKTITCDDNTNYRCYGRFNGTNMYSTNTIYVKVDCSPTWAESVRKPVIYYLAQTLNKYFDLLIIAHPTPTYSVLKYTPSGLQDLPMNVDVIGYTNKVRLYFRTYSEESHGIYRIEANNSIGMLTANVTFRGLTLPPKYVRAWSTSPNSIHVEWTAGELFETTPQYNLYYKSQSGKWGSSISVRNIGSTVTYTFNIFQPNTTYYFLVTASGQYSTSVYSNLAQATTLTNPYDPPQPIPPIYKPVEPTLSPGLTPDGQSTTKQDVSEAEDVCEQDNLTFGNGIGIGLGIGLMLVVIAIMGTVIFFKRSPANRNAIPTASQNHTAESERGDANPMASPAESERGTVSYSHYEQLSPRTTGVGYDNKACVGTQ